MEKCVHHVSEQVSTLSPAQTNSLTVEGEARPLPPAGRLSNATAMRSWLASADRVVFSAQLTPG